MSIIANIRYDERVIRQMVVRQISRQLGERNYVQRLHTAVDYIGEIRERVVMFYVKSRISSQVTHRRQALCIGLPSLTRRQQVAYHVVCSHCPGEVIIVGDNLPGGEHEIVSEGGMGIGVILCRQAVL